MGYYINDRGGEFKMKKEHFADALRAIQALSSVADGYGYRKVVTLEEVLEQAEWEPEFDQAGDIVALHFQGEKAGDEDRLFAAIAPFVEHGSYIEMSGEEDALWQWRFVNGKVEEAHAEIVWPPFPPKINT